VTQALPRHARVVIAGGGITGCSVGYHLAKLGWRDVLLLEQGQVAGGTTWHAAGMIGRLRTSSSMARINDASAKLYASLEAETGCPTGWNKVGSLLVARTEDRMIQFRRTAALSGYFARRATHLRRGSRRPLADHAAGRPGRCRLAARRR
jgi:4-methylaminobutanoate oxidase (formaldehyde-forming)